MKYIKILLTLALCFCYTLSYAQKRVTGRVWSKTDGAIVLANVVENLSRGGGGGGGGGMKTRLAMVADLALRSVQLQLAMVAMAMAMAMAMVLVHLKVRLLPTMGKGLMKVRLLPTMGKGLLKIGGRSSAQVQDRLVLM